MKKTLCLYFALFAMFTSFAAKAPFSFDKKKSETTDATVGKTTTEVSNDASSASLSKLSLKDLQKTLGRKLTLEEKLSWLLFKKRLIHIEPSDADIKHANTNAVLGFVFSIVGLVFFQLLGIPGLLLSNKALDAEKVDPGILKKGNKGLATAGKIISIVDLAILLIVVVAVIVILSNWH